MCTGAKIGQDFEIIELTEIIELLIFKINNLRFCYHIREREKDRKFVCVKYHLEKPC